jgi:hypothetical protein
VGINGKERNLAVDRWVSIQLISPASGNGKQMTFNITTPFDSVSIQLISPASGNVDSQTLAQNELEAFPFN